MLALLAALALCDASSPVRPEVPLPPPPVRDGVEVQRRDEPVPPPGPRAGPDADEEVIRNLELLENLPLLENLEAFDTKADDDGGG
jgi:hypothetical protein